MQLPEFVGRQVRRRNVGRDSCRDSAAPPRVTDDFVARDCAQFIHDRSVRAGDMMAQVRKTALSAVASSNQTAISSHISFRPTSCPLLPLSFISLSSPAPRVHPGHPPALAAIGYECCASHKFRQKQNHIAPHLSLCRTLHVSAFRSSPFHKRGSDFFVAFQRWFRASADSGSETEKTSPRRAPPKAQKLERQKDDPGECKYSPEWFGTQGGGWGRNPGATIFAESSAFGNGVVSVTAHESSRQVISGQVSPGFHLMHTE